MIRGSDMEEVSKEQLLEQEETGEAAVEAERIKDEHQNYDVVLKDAVTAFSGKALDVFGLDKDVRILEPLRTEKKEIRVEIEYQDLTFRLSDGRGLHIEAEVALSHDDLLRFCGYHVDLVRLYRMEFHTIILARDFTGPRSIDHAMLKFEPQVIHYKDFDADVLREKIRQQIENGEPINEIELVYLPLFYSDKLTPEDLLRDSVSFAKKLPIRAHERFKLIVLAMIVSNKVVSKEALESIWKEVRDMNLKILELAEEKGIEKVALNMLKDGLSLDLISKVTGLTIEKLKELAEVLAESLREEEKAAV